MKKCLVHGCKNHRHQGEFVGDLCSPCHYMLTGGQITSTSSFLGDIQKENDMLRKKFEAHEKLWRDFGERYHKECAQNRLMIRHLGRR